MEGGEGVDKGNWSHEDAHPGANYAASFVSELLMDYSLLSDVQRMTSMYELQEQKPGYGQILHCTALAKEAMYREPLTDQGLEHWCATLGYHYVIQNYCNFTDKRSR